MLGIGRASLFASRSGKRSITKKTWLKLEAAEREAGIGVGEAAGPDPDPPPAPSDLRADLATQAARLDRIETLLSDLLERLDALVPQTSSEAPGDRPRDRRAG